MSKSTVETIITNKINEGYGLTKLNSNQRIIIIGSRPNCNGDWMKDYGIHKNTKEQLILFANKYNIQDYSIEETDTQFELSNKFILSNNDYLKIVNSIIVKT